jgi:hypothetical protein
MRTCSECWKKMKEWYCIDSGWYYYCSDECMLKNMTQEEYDELYDDGEGDTYWTEREEWDEDEDDDEIDIWVISHQIADVVWWVSEEQLTKIRTILESFISLSQILYGNKWHYGLIETSHWLSKRTLRHELQDDWGDGTIYQVLTERRSEDKI